MRNGSYESNPLGHGELQACKHRIHIIKELFEFDEFMVRYVDYQDRDELTATVKFLNTHGAIRSIDRKPVVDAGDTRYRHLWKWRQDAKDALMKYWKQLEKLPCGHRAHIYNHPNREGYSCKHCDDWPEYDRETIEQCL